MTAVPTVNETRHPSLDAFEQRRLEKVNNGHPFDRLPGFAPAPTVTAAQAQEGAAIRSWKWRHGPYGTGVLIGLGLATSWVIIGFVVGLVFYFIVQGAAHSSPNPFTPGN